MFRPRNSICNCWLIPTNVKCWTPIWKESFVKLLIFMPSHFPQILTHTNIIWRGKQECIPVGCVPPAHWSYLCISSYPMHAPPGSNHACPPGSNHTCPPGSNHAPPRATTPPLGATTHPPSNHTCPPGSNHACPTPVDRQTPVKT